MKFERIEELNTFVNQVDNFLNDPRNQMRVNYSPASMKPWNSKKFLEENKTLLGSVSGKANIYAIFCAGSLSEDYILQYIGKTTKKLSRQRIINHLIKKHEKTGAKLKKVQAYVLRGGKIKISWVGIEPESLRNCIEEELIHKHPEAEWNRENASESKKPENTLKSFKEKPFLRSKQT